MHKKTPELVRSHEPAQGIACEQFTVPAGDRNNLYADTINLTWQTLPVMLSSRHPNQSRDLLRTIQLRGVFPDMPDALQFKNFLDGGHLSRVVSRLAVLFALVQPVTANVVRVETALNGNKLSFVELEATSGSYPNRVVPFENLIAADVIDFLSVVESNTANTVALLATPDSVIPAGDDRLRLLGDEYLNTGIFNPAYGTPGIHVAFQKPVINGPGVDFVAFELTIGSGQTPDPMEILQVDNVGSILNIVSGDYQLQGVIPPEAAPNTFQVTVGAGGAATFETLRDAQFNLVGTVTNPKWHAISIDLGSLGVPEWGSVSELYLLSDNLARNAPVDLLMVAGLPPVFRPGDYDDDLDVDGRDFLVWQREFGNGIGSPADGTVDGMVDQADFALWQQHYSPASATAALNVVPEPGAIALVLALTVGFFAASCRRW